MMYYVRWNGSGEVYQEIFDDLSEARKCAKVTSRIPWVKEADIIDENGAVVIHYVLGFMDE